jgi:hypothetical protein
VKSTQLYLEILFERKDFLISFIQQPRRFFRRQTWSLLCYSTSSVEYRSVSFNDGLRGYWETIEAQNMGATEAQLSALASYSPDNEVLCAYGRTAHHWTLQRESSSQVISVHHHKRKQVLGLKTCSFKAQGVLGLSSSSTSSHVQPSQRFVPESQLRYAASIHSFQVI